LKGDPQEVNMSSEYKRFYRSRADRMVAGVCGGIGAYFNADPTLIRLLFVGAAFINPPGAVLAYLIMMLVVPEEPLEAPTEAIDAGE
jgi:phage shock protein C